MEIFKLFGSIFVDSSKAEESISKTSEKADGLASKLGKGVVGGAKAAGKALAGAGAAVGAVGAAMFAAAKKTAEYGDKIDKNSQKMGISRKAYQEWDAVLQHSGSSIDNMSKVFKEFATISTDATDDQIAAFEQLGLSMEDIGNMSPEEIFAATIEGLQGMEEGAERSALANTLLGKSATELAPLLNTSAEDTKAMIDRVNELGGVMSDDAVKNSAAFQDAMQDLQTAFGGIANEVGAAVMPIFTDLMNWVTDHMPEIREIVLGALRAIGIFWTETLKPKFDDIKKVVVEDVMPAFLEAFESFSDFWKETLQPALDELWRFILDTVIPKMIGAFKSYINFWNEKLKPIFTALFEFVRDTVAPIVVSAFETVSKFINDTLIPAFKSIKKWWDENGGPIIENVQEKFGAIKDAISGAVDLIAQKIAQAKLKFDELKSKAQSLYQGIKDTFDDIKSKVEYAVEACKKAIQELKDTFTWSGIQKNANEFKNNWVDNTQYDSEGHPIMADGYENPHLFASDTEIGLGGRMTTVGDLGRKNGGELVYSHDNLMEDISAASGSHAIVERLDEFISAFGDFMDAFSKMGMFIDGDKMVGALAPGIQAHGETSDKMRKW